MTLRSRLSASLVLIAIILVGPLVLAISSLYRLRNDARTLRDREFAASLVIGQLREGLTDLRQGELALLFTRTVASRDAMDREVGAAAKLADSLSHFQLPTYAHDISESIRQLAAAAPNEYQAALAGDTTRADSLSAHVFVPALERADSVVIRAERELRVRTTQRVASQAATIATTAKLSAVALVLALVFAAAIAIWLTRAITRPIAELRRGMQAVADGELEYPLAIPTERSDELGDLATGYREMVRQLGELDKLKAEFVSVASHELKTPINVIIGYLQLLEEGLYGPLTDKQREVHRTLTAQANNLQRLVKQLLDVSRFEAGGGRLDLRVMRLDDLLEELERAFHVLALQREIRFSVERRPGLPSEVFWDSDRVNEVMGNLLANAFKFTPRGGTVGLHVEPVDGSVRLAVSDTGAGIPPEQVPRIFDKFYQADNQRSAATSGSGLGLAIAKQIVEAHGGAITCESTLGVGTTFSITLPARVPRRSSAGHAVTHT